MKQERTKKLQAAHHRWLRKILQISWKDKVTQQEKLENIIRERSLRWTGHVMRMDQDSTTKAAVKMDTTKGEKKTRASKHLLDSNREGGREERMS